MKFAISCLAARVAKTQSQGQRIHRVTVMVAEINRGDFSVLFLHKFVLEKWDAQKSGIVYFYYKVALYFIIAFKSILGGDIASADAATVVSRTIPDSAYCDQYEQVLGFVFVVFLTTLRSEEGITFFIITSKSQLQSLKFKGAKDRNAEASKTAAST